MKNGFMSYNSKDLEYDLRAETPTSRLLSKDIIREQNLPGLIAGGARDKGLVGVTFFANAGAGDFTETVTLDYNTSPLTNVWFLGTYSKDGTITSGGGLLPCSFDVSVVTNGASIFSGAQSAYSVNKDELTIGVTSTNVGCGS